MKLLYHSGFKHTYSTELWISKALQELGVEVIQIREGADMLHLLKEYAPDVLMYGKAKKTPNLREALRYCKDNGILTVCWLFDLYLGLPRHYEVRDAIFSADIVCSTDGGHNDLWKKNGVNHHTLRQGIYAPEAHLGKPYNTNVEIAFVGCDNPWWPERKMLMKHLKYKYKSIFQWYGRGVPLRGEDLNDMFASVKIIVGDSVYSPNYWSNRVYETLGRGGFLLHPRVPGLEKEFEYYKHLVPYDINDYDQIDGIIDHYLKADKEREEIQLAGHEHCKKLYTYKHRCKQLIKLIHEEKRSS